MFRKKTAKKPVKRAAKIPKKTTKRTLPKAARASVSKKDKELMKAGGVAVPKVGGSNAASALYGQLSKLGTINQDFLWYNEDEPPVREFIPIGIVKMDKALGGGLPIGRMGEVFGKNATGKSTLTYHIGAAVQRAGGYVVSIDTEHSWDEARFEGIGGIRESTMLAEADTIEDIFEILNQVLSNQASLGDKAPPCLVVIDTITGASTQDELNAILTGKEVSRMSAADRARYISVRLKGYIRQLGACRMAVIFVNQVRQILGAMPFQEQFDSTGGEAIKFYSSWRIKTGHMGWIKSGEEAVGQKIRFETIKCKTAPSRKKFELDLDFVTGKFDQFTSLIEECKSRKLLTKRKDHFKISEDMQGLGMKEEYESDESFRADFEKHLDKITAFLGKPAVVENGEVSPDEGDPDGEEEK